MFATAHAVSVSQRQVGAYKQVHVATGVDDASPHGLIAMLYDGLITAMTEARGAIRSRNIAAKGQAIARALRIVDEGLNASLDMSAGGALAGQLSALYDYVVIRLTHANLHSDESAIEECVRLIEPVRSAWSQIASRLPS